MIEIRGRKYRDHAHLLAEYERELAEIEGKSGAAEADDAKEPVNEDRRMLLEAIEAHAGQRISQKALRFNRGVALLANAERAGVDSFQRPVYLFQQLKHIGGL